MGANLPVDEDVLLALAAASRGEGSSPEQLLNSILRRHLSARVPAEPEKSTERLRLMEETLGAIVDAVIIIDQQADIEYLNPAAEELTTWALEDARGKPVGAVVKIASEQADWLAHHLVQTCLQEGLRAAVQDDALLQNRAGREVSVDGVASPLRNETGNIVGAALVLRDITARKRAEAALTAQRDTLELLVARRTADLKALQDELLKKERLAALGHLTATVSHEIRNPLGTIANSVHVIQQRVGAQVSGLEVLFERVDRNIKRCTRIIAELLDFTHSRQLHYERLDFDAWLGKVLDELDQPSAVKVDRDFGYGRSLTVDPERLRRAIINICDNANQAMLDADGLTERKLTVRTRAVPGKLELSFIDTGPGMSDEVRAQIFRELFSTKRFGVGLGLPIVKQIIDQHGGEVHVQSTHGAGTRVVMRIPIRREPDGAAGA